MAYRHKGKKKKYFSFNKGNFAFMALCFLVIAAGMFLISGQYAKAYRTQITYEKQQQDIRLGEEQEKELLKDKQNLDNPEMFEVNKLKERDEVSYVRFASVYREFRDIDTFLKELRALKHQMQNEKNNP